MAHLCLPRPMLARRLVLILAVVLLTFAHLTPAEVRAAAAGDVTELAVDGEARLPIIIDDEAAEHVRESAAILADYLERISGAPFEIVEGDATAAGIILTTAATRPALVDQAGYELDPHGRFTREAYVLQSRGDRVYVIGASDMAVRYGVWDLLHQLGHRQFFPTETWESIPSEPDLRLAVDVREEPDYHVRRGPRKPGRRSDEANETWQRWQERNRVNPNDGSNASRTLFTVRTGHSYHRIYRRNREAFEANPQFFALSDGKREWHGNNTKFCISNPGLRELVVADRVRLVEENPHYGSVSIDPSDGYHWCECEACNAIDGVSDPNLEAVSDRVVMLANAVAEGLEEAGHDDVFVGTYAYNRHSDPPVRQVHPHIIVSVATALARSQYSTDELIEGWAERGATLGIRCYHAVHAWNPGLPRGSRAARPEYYQRNIPHWYDMGARFMNSESTDDWGSNGLGYYLSLRMLWNIDEADRIDALVDDFLEKSFGEASEPMRAFYETNNLDELPRTTEDRLARMYRSLEQARALTDDPEVMARLDELALYTRHVELFHDYQNNTPSDERQAAFEAILKHAWQIRDTQMVHVRRLWTDRRARRDEHVEFPEDAAWGVPASDNRLKPADTIPREGIDRFIAEGVERFEPEHIAFTPVEFSPNLVPARETLGLPDVSEGRIGHQGATRGTANLYTWLDAGTRELELAVTGGLIAHYRDRGNVRLFLDHLQDGVEELEADSDESTPPDGETYEVRLRSPYDGLHRLRVSDGGDRTRVEMLNTRRTMEASIDNPYNLSSWYAFYFYVPEGTDVVGGYISHDAGELRTADDETIIALSDVEGVPGYFAVEVPEGMDGSLWKMHRVRGEIALMTVPPYVAITSDDLLLPREVVEADGAP